MSSNNTAKVHKLYKIHKKVWKNVTKQHKFQWKNVFTSQTE